MRVKLLALFVSALLLGQVMASSATTAASGAQQRIRSRVDLIEVAVLARDAAGRAVTDLRADELTVLENGVPQKIVGLHRVSLPVDATTRTSVADVSAVPLDVATNEELGASRVFVLVLDALHIAPARLANVKRLARQFIEQHVGPKDLVAVFSPGAPPEATEDFTTDRAKLAAAIDRFTSSKLRSATVERAEEERMADFSRIVMHGGKDPSDGERAARVRSLSSVLQALARHLDRIGGRRKALLLFSEGVDYDTGDVTGKVQREASAVTRSMNEAVGALMRSNVALYAIDPRALSTAAGEMLERPVFREIKPEGTLSSLGTEAISPMGLELEHAASIRSLKHLAESTGGFAAVTSNDASRTFERVVNETSDYYMVGYTPAIPPKPGDSRSIAVRTSRAGVVLVARKGYVVPKQERQDATAGEPELPSFTAPGRRRSRMAPPPMGSAAPRRAAGGPAPELAALLASPLPTGDLPVRVQAIPFGGDDKKRRVHLVVEVLGGTLRFTERSGRAEERIELAILTVNGSGEAGNGESTAFDLRLPPDELQRVVATGVRWLSKLELPPGRYQLRVAARAVGTGTSGLVTYSLEVPDRERNRLALSGLTMTSLPAAVMLTRGTGWLENSLRTPPSAARRFIAGDKISVAAELYLPDGPQADPEVVAEIEGPGGRRIATTPSHLKRTTGDSHIREVSFTLETAPLAAGAYVFRVIAAPNAPPHRVERAVAFELVRAR